MGRWIEMDDGWFQYHYCSNCGYKHFDPEHELPIKCPSCNSDMEVKNNEDNNKQ